MLIDKLLTGIKSIFLKLKIFLQKSAKSSHSNLPAERGRERGDKLCVLNQIIITWKINIKYTNQIDTNANQKQKRERTCMKNQYTNAIESNN